ncbi:hypothetical protein K466DRAFT_501920 [Polyporus arcularius HHB13444]|uniref:Uncharacterized protein n=1 Tax=Polyporus arcularius HHB13444 TaxID=1314778 RepID=A0A5C3P6Z6_9APHY|nr:hypothetical protein K466DRAFT_501920 [Polyporus arcularius HHB13444]
MFPLSTTSVLRNSSPFQGTLSHYVRGLLYPAANISPVIVLIPVSASADLEPNERCWLDDITVDRWFPHGWESRRISFVPSTSFRLRNHYTIYTSADTHRDVRNRSLRNMGISHHRGNVLVLRTSVRHYYQLTHVHSAERALVDFIVTR